MLKHFTLQRGCLGNFTVVKRKVEKMSCSSDLLLGERQGDYKKQKVHWCECVCVWKRQRKIGKNKKEEKRCWGPFTLLGLPYMLIRNTRSFPPEFIITGADSLEWPGAHTYPTVCQQISNLCSFSFSLLMFPPIHKQLSTPQSWTLQQSQAHPRAAWHLFLCADGQI